MVSQLELQMVSTSPNSWNFQGYLCVLCLNGDLYFAAPCRSQDVLDFPSLHNKE